MKMKKKIIVIALIAALVVMFSFPATLFANPCTTYTITVQKSATGFDSGVFTFDLYVNLARHGGFVKVGSVADVPGTGTGTIDYIGGTTILTFDDHYDNVLGIDSRTFYVVESGTNGADGTNNSIDGPPTVAVGDANTATAQFTVPEGPSSSKTVYFANIKFVPAVVTEPAAAAGPTVYTITASTEGPGSITDPGVFNISAGADKIYTITAGDGASIVDVLVNGASLGPVSSNTFLHVNSSQTIHAIFGVVAVAAITEEAAEEVIEVAAAEEVIEVAALEELPRTGNNMLFYVIGFALIAVGGAFGSFFIPKALRKREN